MRKKKSEIKRSFEIHIQKLTLDLSTRKEVIEMSHLNNFKRTSKQQA